LLPEIPKSNPSETAIPPWGSYTYARTQTYIYTYEEMMFFYIYYV
jgi:hypothetical protein